MLIIPDTGRGIEHPMHSPSCSGHRAEDAVYRSARAYRVLMHHANRKYTVDGARLTAHKTRSTVHLIQGPFYLLPLAPPSHPESVVPVVLQEENVTLSLVTNLPASLKFKTKIIHYQVENIINHGFLFSFSKGGQS